MPYNENLKLFYLNYLPYITIILFVFTTIFLLNPKNKLEYFIVTLAILNPSTLLLIERFNNDIFCLEEENNVWLETPTSI